ncbi:MAG: tRNA pseudouridine(55) synthase TruB [Pseudomonadota bacterium]
MNVQKAPWEAVNGVLLLNKPRGLTSQQALFRVRRRLRAAKAGHGGTLDPLADGLLMLCFGAATKFAQRHLEADKRYVAVLQLGARTTSDDAEGEFVERRAVRVDRAQVDAVLPRFLGAISQTPPVYSALKRDGRPLYAYARAGEAIEVAARTVHIHAIEVLSLVDERLTLAVHCGKGTYIRALARDIGEALGCGAHLAALTRTASGSFELTQALALEAAEALDQAALRRQLLPTDVLLQAAPRLDLDAAQTQRFLHGARLSDLQPGGLIKPGEDVRIYGPLAAGQAAVLLGIGALESGVLAPRRLLCADELAPDAAVLSQKSATPAPISSFQNESPLQDATP